MKNYLDFTFKKGDKLKVFSSIRNKVYDCTFVKYELIEENGIFISFGPKNIKKAKHASAKIELINEYGYKEKWRLIGDDELKNLIQE
jgi:hypothetical protein